MNKLRIKERFYEFIRGFHLESLIGVNTKSQQKQANKSRWYEKDM